MMNKEKIMKCFDTILEITDDFNMPSTNWKSNSLVVRHKAKEGIKELNVKPVMPKVFNTWYKNSYGDKFSKIYHFSKLIYLNVYENEIEAKLLAWVYENDKRYLSCIDAIRYGYEVEK